MTFPTKSKIFLYFIGLIGTMFLLWAKDEPCFKKPSDCPVLRLRIGTKTFPNDWSRMCAGNVIKAELNKLFPPRDEADTKYVLASYWRCGGLGNQMWRFASLYGIGKPYGRIPIFTEDQRCLKANGGHEVDGDNDEIKRTFPVYGSQLKHIKFDKEQTFILHNYATDCCKYDDPERINFGEFHQKYVQIKGDYFQSYKYFESRRHEIRQIFQFAPDLCADVQKYRSELFHDDHKSHKLCVHTRLGDFKRLGYESKKDFTEKGTEFAYRHLMEAGLASIAVILMGSDKHFLTGLNINRTLIPNVYLPKPMSRSFDMAFGTVACDSLLITASASTFSWWIGYLMPDNATIFYNSDVFFYPRENFLPEWIPLKMIDGNRIAMGESAQYGRWHFILILAFVNSLYITFIIF